MMNFFLLAFIFSSGKYILSIFFCARKANYLKMVNCFLSPLSTGSGCLEPRIQQDSECERERNKSASNSNACHQQARGRGDPCVSIHWLPVPRSLLFTGAEPSPSESAWHEAGEALWWAAYEKIPSFTRLFY